MKDAIEAWVELMEMNTTNTRFSYCRRVFWLLLSENWFDYFVDPYITIDITTGECHVPLWVEILTRKVNHN